MTSSRKSNQQWHLLSVPETLQQLGDVAPQMGLSEANIAQRREQYGLNKLEERPLKSPLLILWEQFTEVMVVVLIV